MGSVKYSVRGREDDLRAHLRLMVITDRQLSRGRTDEEICRQAFRGGATAVQLRLKSAGDRDFLDTARAVARLAGHSGTLFVINDRPDIAMLCGAAACHLGPSDLNVEQVRRLAGSSLRIGFSVRSAEGARAAARQGADYLGVGPVFPTRTKMDAPGPIGLARLAEVASATSLPVVAIGGIDHDSAGRCIEAGACGVALISAVVGAASVAPTVRRLRRLVDAASRPRQG